MRDPLVTGINGRSVEKPTSTYALVIIYHGGNDGRPLLLPPAALPPSLINYSIWPYR